MGLVQKRDVLVSGDEAQGGLDGAASQGVGVGMGVRVVFGNVLFGLLLFGGAEVQIHETREALAQHGVDVTLFSLWDKHLLDNIDLVHWFHIDPGAAQVFQIAKRRGIPTVVTAIYWPSRCWPLSYVWTRASVLPRRIGIPLDSYASLQRQFLHLVDVVLASSKSEARYLRAVFGVDEKRLRVVPVGVSSRFALADPSLFVGRFGLRDFVLCVGRIEPRKNQLRLVKAMAGLGIPTVFIGDTSVD